MAENVMCWMTSAQTPAPAIAATRPAVPPKSAATLVRSASFLNCSPRWTYASWTMPRPQITIDRQSTWSTG